jgi:hypothetical protein
MPSSTAIQRLSKLKELRIRECRHLSKNCRKKNGSEWPKISHIPEIYIEVTREQVSWDLSWDIINYQHYIFMNELLFYA